MLHFVQFLDKCKVGCRLLTYNNLHERLFGTVLLHLLVCPSKVPDKNNWKQLDINISHQDRFSTSWGEVHFFLYEKVK